MAASICGTSSEFAAGMLRKCATSYLELPADNTPGKTFPRVPYGNVRGVPAPPILSGDPPLLHSSSAGSCCGSSLTAARVRTQHYRQHDPHQEHNLVRTPAHLAGSHTPQHPRSRSCGACMDVAAEHLRRSFEQGISLW